MSKIMEYGRKRELEKKNHSECGCVWIFGSRTEWHCCHYHKWHYQYRCQWNYECHWEPHFECPCEPYCHHKPTKLCQPCPPPVGCPKIFPVIK